MACARTRARPPTGGYLLWNCAHTLPPTLCAWLAHGRRRWESSNGKPIGRRKVAGMPRTHFAYLEPEAIWKGHRAHWRNIKRHARAQYVSSLGRHQPRLRALLGLPPPPSDAPAEVTTEAGPAEAGEAEEEGEEDDVVMVVSPAGMVVSPPAAAPAAAEEEAADE